MRELILAADIGGTKADMGLFSVRDGHLIIERISSAPTTSYGSAMSLLDTFLLMDAPKLKAACIGIAGPVIDEAAVAPNLPWNVSLSQLKKSLETDKVELLNDLVATAYGIADLKEDNLVVLQAGEPSSTGAKALIAPGTGLGEAVLIDGKPLPSEGGHADFAPGNEIEIDLLKYMVHKHETHISWEKVASGPGLQEIYDFVLNTGLASSTPTTIQKLASMDPSSVVATEAMECSDEACRMALNIFISILGAEAGNLALKSLSTGGVFIGGGIPPKILPALKSGAFMERFTSKGRMEKLLRQIPVSVITEPRTALYGAAARAMQLITD